ncbi:hypothetical protein U8V72_24660 [Priestia filamentosa]|uniref:hypothetical protein n=1 Tax=Priestia filamentosa TaxID=1402861 RepID=UPI0039790468
MELIRIAQRGLRYKDEATLYIEREIKELLKKHSVKRGEQIIKILETTYDERVFVNSIKLLHKDTSGQTLRDYLKM